MVSIRIANGEKSKAQHLTTTINEVYAMFKIANPDIKIGWSKFSELRLSSQLPQNVCLCKYHENFIMAINTLNKEFGQIIPKYDHDLPARLVSAEATEDCWFNWCATCRDAKLLKSMFSLEESIAITWYVWGKDGEGKLCKMVKEGTTDDLFDHLCSIPPEFLRHCHVKRNQADSYNREREDVGCEGFDKSFALLQVTAALTSRRTTHVSSKMKYKVLTGNRSESACSLQPFHPTVIPSAELNHGKETVVAYIDHLLDTLPAIVKSISIWSDGPSSQFKNRFVVAAISSLQEKHNIDITWNFLQLHMAKAQLMALVVP